MYHADFKAVIKRCGLKIKNDGLIEASLSTFKANGLIQTSLIPPEHEITVEQ